jgi:hypothetical protein
MNCLRLVCAATLAGVAGCALPMLGGGSSAATSTARAEAADTVAVAPPVVQVRAFRQASLVSVVGWDTDDAAFGLRTSVNRSGVLVGGERFGDHRLYLTPYLVHNMGGFRYASIEPGQLLLRTGTQRDPFACFYGKDCSPLTTIGVRVPDSLLRASHDSLVVTFHPGALEDWTLTLRHELIEAYLAKVDSVVAEARKAHTM